MSLTTYPIAPLGSESFGRNYAGVSVRLDLSKSVVKPGCLPGEHVARVTAIVLDASDAIVPNSSSEFIFIIKNKQGGAPEAGRPLHNEGKDMLLVLLVGTVKSLANPNHVEPSGQRLEIYIPKEVLLKELNRLNQTL